ncbi:MAG: DUF1194 domain-containing protein [Pseudomonadota bacterium]
MSIFRRTRTLVATFLLAAGMAAAPAKADVIELALLLDGSGSQGNTGWQLQLSAYKNIFTNAFYSNAIVGGDTLVISAFKFYGGPGNVGVVEQKIGTTLITDDASAATFGNQFTTAVFGTQSGITPTNAALNAAGSWLLSNGYDGDRLIIDVSTDGDPNPESDALSINTAGSLNSTYGIVTNAIGVGSGISQSYLDALTGAGGGFKVVASNFGAFETALEDKLFREVTSVPAPGGLLILGFGLMLSGIRRRSIRS